MKNLFIISLLLTSSLLVAEDPKIQEAITLLKNNNYIVTKIDVTKKILGLDMLASVEEINKISKLTKLKTDTQYGDEYLIDKTPIKINNAERITLYFFQNKLWRIWISSETYPNEPYGNGVKNRYEELKEILKKKYTIELNEHVGKYYKAENFVYYLKEGEAWHYLNFNDDKVSGQLGIRAINYDSSYWYLVYEVVSMKNHIEEVIKSIEESGL